MSKTIKLAKIIRIVTVVPVMALVMLSILYGLRPDIFQETSNFILAIIFLTVFPLLAYPLQLLLPKFRNKGREGQRKASLKLQRHTVSQLLWGSVIPLFALKMALFCINV